MNEIERFPLFLGKDAIRVSDAVIEEINRDDDVTYVTIAYHACRRCAQQGEIVTLVVSRDTIIQDEQSRRLRVGELQEGMLVDAAFSPIMTRSIPPQSQAFFIRVTQRPNSNVTSTGRIVEVNTERNYIMTASSRNPASVIQFNLAPNIVVLAASGKRIRLSMLMPGLQVKVEHANFMTASIPPQTTAYVIQVLR